MAPRPVPRRPRRSTLFHGFRVDLGGSWEPAHPRLSGKAQGRAPRGGAAHPVGVVLVVAGRGRGMWEARPGCRRGYNGRNQESSRRGLGVVESRRSVTAGWRRFWGRDQILSRRGFTLGGVVICWGRGLRAGRTEHRGKRDRRASESRPRLGPESSPLLACW